MPRKRLVPLTPEEKKARQHAYHLKYYADAEYRAAAIARAKGWSEANPEKRLQIQHDYHESHKQEESAYHKERRIKNPEHVRALARAAQQRHVDKDPDVHQNYVNNWRNGNRAKMASYARKRRASKENAPKNDLTNEQWAMILDHYGHRCVYCGRKMQRLSQDHILPLSRGGSHTLSNVVPACRKCNSKKHAGPPLVPVQPLLL